MVRNTRLLSHQPSGPSAVSAPPGNSTGEKNSVDSQRAEADHRVAGWRGETDWESPLFQC